MDGQAGTGTGARATRADRELLLLRFQAELGAHMDTVRDVDKGLRIALRKTREFFAADSACVAVIEPDRRGAVPQWHLPPVDWDPALFALFLRDRRRPKLPRQVLMATLERRERPWAILALRAARDFDVTARRELQRIARDLGKLLARLDRLLSAEVRARIDRKIMAELRPKDLFYQILHGLRSLTHYDHSGALFIHDPQAGTLRLVAEQIAWRKGKSDRVGSVAAVEPDVAALLESNEVYVFDRGGDGWVETSGRDACALARALDFGGPDASAGEGDDREHCVLCAPFATRSDVAGVIRLAARHAGSLGAYEARLVERFVPQAVVAIQTQERAASLEVGMLEAEKKHVMANLARGVSHDVNNALGAVLPLVQQMLHDAREGHVDPRLLAADLEEIEESLQVCRRIFGGMLSFARGAAHHIGSGDLRRAVHSTLAILAEGMRRQGVGVVLDLDESLPPVRGAQGDLEQLVLNLATNAREAMPAGGTLRVTATADGDDVLLAIADTGQGIPASDIQRVTEPFFTTKRHGNGLGLSICRSIVWGMDGRMTIESTPGAGTTIRVRLPALTDEREDAP